MSISLRLSAKAISTHTTREDIMNYEFPTITNISNVLPAITGRDVWRLLQRCIADALVPGYQAMEEKN